MKQFCAPLLESLKERCGQYVGSRFGCRQSRS